MVPTKNSGTTASTKTGPNRGIFFKMVPTSSTEEKAMLLPADSNRGHKQLLTTEVASGQNANVVSVEYLVDDYVLNSSEWNTYATTAYHAARDTAEFLETISGFLGDNLKSKRFTLKFVQPIDTETTTTWTRSYRQKKRKLESDEEE